MPQLARFQRVVMLGTGSAAPKPLKRNVSSMAIQLSSGNIMLVDCGEATQHQFVLSTLKVSRVSSIFITHCHGDHCYGIFGFLHSLTLHGRKEPIRIYGPTGMVLES